MKKIFAFLKQTQWILWASLAVVVGILLWVLRGFFEAPKAAPAGSSRLPPIPEALRAKVEQAQEAALKARVEARVQAAEEKKEIEDISKIPDAAERRRRLAEKLRRIPNV